MSTLTCGQVRADCGTISAYSAGAADSYLTLIGMAAETTWVLPVMFKKIVEFQKTLVEEPPIQLGTPDPYEPPK
jgi:hypothetical protein